MLIFKSLLMMIFALSLAGCGSAASKGDSNSADASELSGKLILTGSSTVSPICSELGKLFEKKHPKVRIDVQTGGSSRGISDARSGVADIGLVSRSLKPDESDLQSHTIAKDGVCVILHKTNIVAELTDKQVIDIYTGKIVNWKNFGGADAPITVVNKAEGRSTLELFAHHYKLKLPDIQAHVIIGDNEQGVKTVAGNPNAIGYVSVGTAAYNVALNVPIKLLPCGGIPATLENVKNGTFPLSRPLNVVTKSPPTDLAKAFIDLLCSKDANKVIEEQFFVPIKY